jgi:hypothetical protein
MRAAHARQFSDINRAIGGGETIGEVELFGEVELLVKWNSWWNYW